VVLGRVKKLVSRVEVGRLIGVLIGTFILEGSLVELA